jgi:hypothetical protein
MDQGDWLAERFEEHRGRLKAVAYRDARLAHRGRLRRPRSLDALQPLPTSATWTTAKNHRARPARMRCRPGTEASVAQEPEPRPESVAKEPEPLCRPGTGTSHECVSVNRVSVNRCECQPLWGQPLSGQPLCGQPLWSTAVSEIFTLGRDQVRSSRLHALRAG